MLPRNLAFLIVCIVNGSGIDPLVPEVHFQVPYLFSILRLEYDREFLDAAIEKIKTKENQTIFAALTNLTNGQSFLKNVSAKSLETAVNESVAKCEGTVFGDLVKFDLTHTINAILDISSLLSKKRLFMKTYLVGKTVMKINGIPSNYYDDDIEEDLRVIETASADVAEVLNGTRSFDSMREITRRLNNLVDPIMSKIIMHELKNIAKSYRYVYGKHLELTTVFDNPIFESFALFGHFLKEYF